ncbi:MAG: linear amide C-N hydrolase [Bdellovibrionaceae bacterium]|nr:linear amide C-N hydrolase [Pseudobdellovibrionaceae bacterium]
MRIFSAFLGTFFFWSAVAGACTTAAIPQSLNKLMVKSYDWTQGHGMVVVNKRNVGKKSLNFHPDATSAEWTSKYGSVTFNQHGREFPLGGMNEKGLAIEIMWLDSSKYPAADERPTVNELQWIQYQLDNYESVKEMYEHRDDLRVQPIYAKVHYLACDPTGTCSTFEYVDKKMVAKIGEEMAVPTLTNNTFEDSVSFLKEHKGFGGEKPIPQSEASLDRFVRASSLATAFDESTHKPVEYAFEILDSVGPTDYSKFHIVYETKTRQMNFRTREYFHVKSIDTDKMDFACEGTKTQMLDMGAKIEGLVNDSFVAYTPEANKAVIKKSLEHVGSLIPPAVVKAWIGYPETTECKPN